MQYTYDTIVLLASEPGAGGFTPGNTTRYIDNPLQVADYDFGGTTPVRTSADTWLKTASYAVGAKHILDRKATENVYQGTTTGSLLSQKQFEYDNYTSGISASGAVQHDSAFSTTYTTRGNLTATKLWRNTDGAWLTTRNQYDDAGNILSVTDANNHAITFSYTDSWSNSTCLPSGGSAKAYLTATTNALNQVTAAKYNSCTGTLASSTDANNQSTSFSYDPLGRALQTNFPDGGQTSITYNEASVPFTVTTTRNVTTTTNEVSTITVDGFGRTTRSSLNSDPEGAVLTDTTYDVLGRVASVSNPYRSTADPTYGLTTYEYDALGRTTLVIPPDGSSTADNIATAYSGNTTTATDQSGKKRKTAVDALGRLTAVWEDPLGLNYETDYTYDALGNLLTVNQKGGSVDSGQWRSRSFTYNSLSQVLTANNPESGTITYTYDNVGSLTSKTSPQVNQTNPAVTQTISYCYDAINRLTRKYYIASPDCVNGTPVVKYSYDQTSYNGLTILNGIGRRTGMSYGSDLVAWTFDGMGRATTERRTISGITKIAMYGYNLDGSLAALTYPSNRVVNYTYSGAGRALSAIDTANNINYAKSATYAPQAALTGALYGYTTSFAGISISNSYNKRLQPTVLSAGAPSQTLLSLTYNFGLGMNDNGNVYGITNNLDGVQPNRPNGSVAFTYDPLNRLASAHTLATDCTVLANGLTKNWGQNFTYDAWGNLYSIAVERCSVLTLSATVDAATNRLTGNGYAYDAAGNMTNDGAHAFTYDAESRIVTAAGVTYTYDGDGKRVKKSSGMLYWTGIGSDPLDESDLNGNVNEEYVFFNGNRIARLDLPSGAVHYYFADHLGSANTVTNATGTTIEQEADYYPYGGERAIVSGPTNYKFTGKERDIESGMDFFGARYYASTMGRFGSPDPAPVGIAPADPQSWNLYAYVRNRPTRSVDINGNWATDVHAQIVTFALQGYLSAAELAALRDEQYAMDKDQSPAHQFKHAMMGPGQNASDESKAMWDFVAERMRAAQQGVTATGTFTSQGLTALGDAIHTLEDYTSPMHTSATGTPLVWRGLRDPIAALKHFEGEASPMADWARIGEAIRLTMAAYMQANPVAAAQHGLTDKTFDAEARRRIEDYVRWFYQSSSFANNDIAEEAARQCALGNPAACGEPAELYPQ